MVPKKDLVAAVGKARAGGYWCHKVCDVQLNRGLRGGVWWPLFFFFNWLPRWAMTPDNQKRLDELRAMGFRIKVKSEIVPFVEVVYWEMLILV